MYGERPTAVVFEHGRLEITGIIKGWRTPTGSAFQVLTINNLSFELTYNEHSDQWSYRTI